MKLQTLFVTALVVGVVANVFDFAVHGVLLAGPLYSGLPTLMRTDASMPLLVLSDFVAALVFVWVYARVRVAFPVGPRGGAIFGLYAGVLVSFPTWIVAYLLIAGFTYGLAWTWTIVGIAWCIVAGAVTGAVAGKMSPAPAR